MARRREDVDWYVEMSEMLERRERRRKWIILGVCVLVPFLLMVSGAGVIYLDSKGHLERIMDWVGLVYSKVKSEDEPTPPATFDPVTVQAFQKGDIVYSQVDQNGLVTSISHFFNELRPGGDSTDTAETPFTVIRTEEQVGYIETYRLRNVGTGEIFDLPKIAAKKVGTAGWMITDVGQSKIKNELQSRMKVKLASIRKQ